MKLAFFDDFKIGVVTGDSVVDVIARCPDGTLGGGDVYRWAA
jgi:hypothetical protein